MPYHHAAERAVNIMHVSLWCERHQDIVTDILTVYLYAALSPAENDFSSHRRERTEHADS